MENYIKVKGARQHNLKNIDLNIPKNKLVVFTGVSGSGKSSMAFDTIYAEGQRRYVESLSTYARQFLGIMEKPDVDLIEGLSPAISIDQKTTSRNPRSTVGTTTEIYDYLRLLYARIGHPHCPICGKEISRQSIEQIVNTVITDIKELVRLRKNVRLMILSPVVFDKKGEFSALFDNLKAKGFTEVRVDKYIKKLNEDFVLIKTNKHTIDAVCDRLTVTVKDVKSESSIQTLKSRLTESIDTATKLSEGLVIVSEIKDADFTFPEYPKNFNDNLYSERFACPIDNIQIPEIEPRSFSFNSPHGACPTCTGLGKILQVNENRLFASNLSIKEGGILPFANMFEHETWFSRLITVVCEEKNINIKAPISSLSKEQLQILLYGTGEEDFKVQGVNRFGKHTYIYETFRGFVNELEYRHKNTESDWVRAEIEKYMIERICPDCNGAKLKKEALSITLLGISISEFTKKNVKDGAVWIDSLLEGDQINKKEKEIATLIVKEIAQRLKFLLDVGLEYLTLDRTAGTLSGGEAQRIRLASQIGSGLTGVLYVLDEPTIGLHQKDNQKLIDTLKKLRDLGNTVVVVEHDKDMMMQSDYIVDFGPGAGKFGGKIISQGNKDHILSDNNSITGKYLSGRKTIEVIPTQTLINISNYESRNLMIYGCSQYNLKKINVNFPLGKLVVVTGVSGSGKSTLLVETLYPAIAKSLNPDHRGEAGIFTRLEGEKQIDKIILIDQSPIGKTPRSNPATYTKLFDEIRDVFATTKEAKVMGFKKSRFSFNLKGGRCESCEGQGQIKIEMQFMSDIWIKCDVCQGKRYNSQTLETTYKTKNIAEVLDMTVSEAKEFFQAHPKISTIIDTLEAVGLGYMQLGQPATTLSGGEAQRVKLSSELAKRSTGNTLYILDEPTTGLHFEDLQKLLNVLKLLVGRGNSVFVIEHNLDVIKNADWVIDLGPDGGDKGGYIVAEGEPKNVAKNLSSYTGNYLSKVV